jgi:nucleoside-diphosphate-sugar epimerase
MTPKVLIIGGEGYIGRAVYKRVSKSFETNIFDLSKYRETNFPGFDIIINLAAHSSVALCQMYPDSAKYNNLERVKEILENLTSKQYLIHASSASVYGIGMIKSKETDELPLPSNLYDETKMAADEIILSALESGKKITSLRFGTVSGISPSTRVDLVLNAMVLSALESSQISVINPEIRRNLLFIDDLIEAIFRLMLENVPGIFNLGSLNLTIGSLANSISKLFPAKIRIEQNGDPSPFDFHLDTSKMENAIGDYRVTTLSETIINLWEGLSETEHIRANMHGPHPMLGM